MAATQADALIERTKVIVGRATATSFLGDTGDRHFVVEAVLTWAAILLLETYLSGFLKPLEKMGERHQKAASALLNRLATEGAPPDDVTESGAAIAAGLAQLPEFDTPERRSAAEDEVRRVLREHGESAAEAARKAAEITEAIFVR